jgi:hypothetical protein
VAVITPSFAIRPRTALFVLLLCVSVAACDRSAPPAAPQPPTNAPASNAPAAGDATNQPAKPAPVDDFEGTVGVTAQERSKAPVAVLRDVRMATQEGFDRVVFEFEGDAAPGYHVEYVDKPVRACGSGEAVAVAGDAWLEIRLVPAQAHDDKGKATVDVRDEKLQFPVFAHLRSTCDFEADVTYVLGLDSPNEYRVLELKSPTRIVVDVEHR